MIFLLLFFTSANCCISEEENAFGPTCADVQVDSNKVQEFVKVLSCMRDDFDPRPQFCTNIILKNKLKVNSLF
jgi:hypothetical protein